MVLCHAPTTDQIDRMARIFNVSHSTFWTLYEKNRDSYDRGDLAPREYWSEFAQGVSLAIDDRTIDQLRQWDIEMWSSTDFAMMQWVKDLRVAGYKTALLSNLHQAFVVHLRGNAEWLKDFDCPLFSSDLRLTKPDPAIFRVCLQILGLQAHEVLFIDDREKNVVAARGEDIAAIRYQSVEQLTRELEMLDFKVFPPKAAGVAADPRLGCNAK